MPIKKSAYQDLDLQTVTLDFGEAGDLNLTFAPNALSYDLNKRAEKAAKEQNDEEMIRLFFSVARTWDLTDDDDQPLPLTIEHIRDLGIQTVFSLITLMQEKLDPDPKAREKAAASKKGAGTLRAL